MDICPVSGETKAEERINHLTHLTGFIFSVVGFICLVVYASIYGEPWSIFGSSIYGATLVFMYASSSWYHGSQHLPRKQKLRIIDHACIYLLIAGSYTPFTLGPLWHHGGLYILIAEWSIACVGIFYKMYNINKFRLLSTFAYLAMGWLIVFSWPAMVEQLHIHTLSWVVAGGVIYSLGTLFFIWESLPFNHGIWHLFVLTGSICHYLAILSII